MLICPACARVLTLVDGAECDGAEVRTGRLSCRGCGLEYPVREFVPRFVSSENYAASFGFEWQRFSRTQYDRYSGTSESAVRFRNETRWCERLDGEVIVEAGCGSGRFTEHAAATGATVISFDYSDAIDVNRRANARFPNVHFLQADIHRIPLRAGLAGRLYCFGVLQHCPSPKAAFMSLLPVLKPGGELVMDVYLKSPMSLLYGRRFLRPFTSRMDPARLFRLVRGYVRWALPLLARVRRVSPAAAGKLSAALAISDFGERTDMTREMAREWSLLDTFDTLSARYEKPQTLSAVRAWFLEAGMRDVDVRCGYNGIVGRGRTAS